MRHSDHLLIVDDDREIRELLSVYLQKNGYRTTAVADGEGLWSTWTEGLYALVILDLMLPGEDGLVLCRNLRARSDVPIIMLTARGEDTDRIVGLEMGADDYLPKPFNPRELLARIKVVLRRAQPVADGANTQPGPRALRFGAWRFDPLARQLLARDGTAVALPSGELRLLQIFLEHPNRPLSRDQLMEWTQGREYLPSDRSIDVQVSRLRKRLQTDLGEPPLIRSVRNLGYVFAARVEVDEP